MPLRHVAQTVDLNFQRLRHLLEKQGVYKVPPPNGRPWSEREVLILRRDYGKLGNSASTIAAKLGRTPNQVTSMAAYLGLNWPLEFRAWENVGGRPKLTAHQQAEALRRLDKGRLCSGDRARLQRAPPDHHAAGAHHKSLSQAGYGNIITSLLEQADQCWWWSPRGQPL